MKEQKPLSAEDFKRALGHIRALVFDDRALFDFSGNLKEILHERAIIFDGEDDTATASALRTELEHLKGLVYRDELTGVLNRRGINGEFGAFFKEALHAKEYPDQRKGVIIKDFSLIFLDIDNFKKVNDTHGHDEGDRVLREVAGVLKTHVRGIDAAGRLGGEEFIAGLLGATEEQAFEKAEEIRKTISGRIRCGDAPITVSVGVASLRHSNAETLERLIEYADKAMYEAKKNRGKNNTVRWSEIADQS